MGAPSPPPEVRKVEARKRRAVVAFVTGFLLALFMILASSSAGRKVTQRWKYEASPAPTFTLADARTGESVGLEAYRGKVILLDFWATWCPPCRKQMPAVERIARDPSLRDTVQVLSINTDEPAKSRRLKVRAFLQRGDYTMRTLLDDGAASRAYEVFSIPTLVVITPEGEVEALRQGVHSEDDLRELIADAAR